MAVSPVMAEILFTAVLKTFAKIDYQSIEPNLQKFLLLRDQDINTIPVVKMLGDCE